MLRSASERYVRDQVRKYPSLDRSYFIRSELMEMWAFAGITLLVYGVACTLVWFLSGPEFAIGVGSAYLGFLVAEMWTHLGRVQAFKRMMPED